MEVTLEQALQNGVKAHRSGQIQEADRYYTAILKVEPKHPDANHNMGVLAVGVGKLKEALPFFKTALDVNPNIDQFWFSYLDVLIRLDRLKDAELLLKQAKDHGLSVEALNRLRGMLSKENKQTTRFATVVNPPQTQVQSLLDLFSGGEFKKVISNSEALLTKFPNSINLYNLIGVSNESLGNLDQAIEAYQKAINIKPDLMELYTNLANAYLKQNKVLETIEVCKQALSIKPNHAVTYHNLGNAFRLQGKFTAAIEAYEKSLTIKPDYAESLNNLGVIFHERGEHEKAVEFYLKALLHKSDYVDAHFNLGNAFKDQNKLEDAIEAYKKATTKKPDFADAFNNLGNIYFQQGRRRESLLAYKKVIEIKPDYADAYNNLGVVLREEGNLEDAIKAYEKAILIKPEYTEAYNNLGVVLNDKRRFSEAIDVYETALTLSPTFASVWCNLGNVYYDQGNLDKSITSYFKAISLKPNEMLYWNNVSFPLKALNSSILSDKYFEKLLLPEEYTDFSMIAKTILRFKVSYESKNKKFYYDEARKLIKLKKNQSIQNPAAVFETDTEIKHEPMDIVALAHFGRSGTGLLHSLVDGHPEISSLPSIYFSEFFNEKNWEKIISNGWHGLIDNFMSIYDVLFDATSSVPIETKGNKLIENIGIKEGMANLGTNKDEVFYIHRVKFKEELQKLINQYVKIDSFRFFELVNVAFTRAQEESNHKKLIFYHIHNPDTYAQINFSQFAPKAKWLLMVREPIQSCESWINKSFSELNYSKVVSRIQTMLYDIDNIVYCDNGSVGIRLEDLKNHPKHTIQTLCEWLGITTAETLFEMTAQGKRWWGDPSSPDYTKSGMNPFGKSAIMRRVGSIFSQRDQFILKTLFHPFSVRFGYAEHDPEQLKCDINEIKPMIYEMFDFEKSLARNMDIDQNVFMGSGTYKFFHASLMQRWKMLEEFNTYPNLITPLHIK